LKDGNKQEVPLYPMASLYNDMETYFQRCVQNMYAKIKEHGLEEAILNQKSDEDEFDYERGGFLFCNHEIISKISELTEEDGHSGSSFACCCNNVYYRLVREKKQQMRARFKGVVMAIVQFKRLRHRALERFYAPGGKGFLNAQEEFYRIQHGGDI
jgi:hypothetical protein